MEWKQIEEIGLFRDNSRKRDEILVLHVDDAPQFGDLVSIYLEKIDDNFTVVTETDAESGLDRIETNPIDCVISDYQMPKMDGLEFLEAVREEYPNLPFILFTGRGSEEVASRATTAGVTSIRIRLRRETSIQRCIHLLKKRLA